MPAFAASVPELSVVIPTMNEAGNVRAIVDALAEALRGIAWEAIFVDDDSPDGTSRLVKEIAQRDGQVRCLRRIGRRGLAGAAMEGMLASSAAFVALIDGDMQHDEKLLARMLEEARAGADLVIGTRHAPGRSANGGFSVARRLASLAATTAARRLLGLHVSDPMSGFFLMRRDRLDEVAPRLSTQGFKVLADILVSERSGLRTVELPYDFRRRLVGQSKLDSLVAWDFATLLMSKLTGGVLTPRFLTFSIVGGTGLVIHLMALNLGLDRLQLPFDRAQLAAALTAMIWNFVLNNALTYRDRRLRGWDAVRGLVTFCAVCSIGAIANVGVATWVYGNEPIWWLAGAAGALMGAVFNYSVNTAVTWRNA